MKKKTEHHTFTVLIEQDEDGYYVATVPALKIEFLLSHGFEQAV